MLTLLDEAKALVPALARQIATLPPSLSLRRIGCYRSSASIVEQRRSAFRKIKTSFLRYCGDIDAEALRMMGLNEYAITRMRDDGRLPANKPGEQMDCTVDHILSIALGGANTYDNMMLVPTRINALKNDIERAQHSAASYAEIITIVPTYNDTRVPYIPGGFQRATHETASERSA